MFESKKRYSLSDFKSIVSSFLKRDYRFPRFQDVMAKQEGLGQMNLNRVFLMRHDIDHDLDTAVKIAEIEADLGIQSTFFALPGSPYWPSRNRIGGDSLQQLLSIQDMGHEVGIHNDSISAYFLEGIDPVTDLRRRIGELRDEGLEIRGSSSHGSSAARKYNFRNYEVFSEMEKFAGSSYFGPRISFNEVELEYEAYELGFSQYWTDSGGSKRVLFNQKGRSSRLDLVVEVGMLVHPVWWGTQQASIGGW